MMGKNMLYLLSLFQAALIASAQQEYCSVDCAGKPAGSFIPDPYDCHRYYGCLEDGTPTDTPLTCPSDQYFDVDDMRCETESTPCKRPCPQPACPLTCHGSISTIANPENCTQFYVCEPDGSTLLQECSSDMPYFDGIACVEEPQMCCDPCQVECQFPGTELVDPYNCGGYFFCAADGELYEAQCDDNTHFSPVLGHCVDGSYCQDVCSNSTDFSTTTSTSPTTSYWNYTTPTQW